MPSTESVSHDDLIVCSCGDREFKGRDAIHAALWRGELDAIWANFVKCLGAEKRADELDLDYDEGELDSAAEAFRYEHDLITAEETEQWLAARGLSLDDFGDYFARQSCGKKLADEVAFSKMDYVSAPGELRQLFAADSILSGDLDRMTSQLVWRLAARAAQEAEPEALSTEEARFFDRHSLKPAELPTWLSSLGREATWFGEMLAMEAAYRDRCETLLVPQARQHELSTMRLPLTRFVTEVLEVESRDAAQEALFCVREDGMSMEEVAAEGRYPHRHIEFLLEDLPMDLQQKFLSVSPGDVLEPMPRGDGFELCRITQKLEPKADDPAVRSRIEQRLLDRHFSDLSSKHVERRLGAATLTE
ncbi:MAG: hypothetical protein JWO45_834 [Spartobacteria bacterium]|nr:hypothetical protein [Spartobacteria bacterium]